MLLSWQRCLPWRQRRKSAFFGQLLVLFLLLLFLYSLGRRRSWLNGSTAAPRRPPRPPDPLLNDHASFWRALYEIILNNDPQCEVLPVPVVPQKLDLAFDPSHDHPRADVLWMEPADIKRMQVAHTNFVSDMRTLVPNLVYTPETRGLVMTAGFGQLPVVVISIRMLRRTWSVLPVEVFLGQVSDYDPDICETVLPSLNAKCVVFSDIVHAARTGVALDKFQYKIMSVIFSSFEDVLLLDSDAFPIYDPEILFDSEPFNTTGMVLWPDFWYASESPYYFEIAKLGDPPPLNAQPSTEAGEILYSKPKHLLSLFLAAYYNYYGPQYYYLLHSQGAPGQGDKETFGWAARAMHENFYSVHEPVIALGHLDSGGEYFGSAMAQHDPTQDFQRITSIDVGDSKEFGMPQTKGAPDSEHIVGHGIRPFFIHANYPKFDPSTIFLNAGPTRDSNGTSVRCWLDEAGAIQLFGFDLERVFWEEIMGTACEYEHLFGCWKGKTGICNGVRKYWYDVFATTS